MNENLAPASLALKRAYDLLGGPGQIAKRITLMTCGWEEPLTLTTAAVTNWHMRGEVPPVYCPLIEQLTDGQVRCEELNPAVAWGLVRNRTLTDAEVVENP